MSTPRRSWTTLLAVAAAALALAHLADPLAYAYLHDPRVNDRDWGRMLRVMGFAPLWLLAAAALALADGPAGPGRPAARVRSRALLLLGSVALSGVAGEALKILLRRERPWAHDGAYVFRPWSERPLSGGGLALPSTHAIVAFGAAFMLARLFPRARPVWWLLAAGCAYTRVAARAHFVSDVVLAALVAWVVVAGLWRGRRWWGLEAGQG